MVSPWMANGEVISYLHSKDWEGAAFVCEFNRLVREITLIYKHTNVDALPEQTCQIARGIEYLHQQGIVHGDIRGVRSPSTAPICFFRSHVVLKPNVLVDGEGNARITDFGTATLVGVRNLRNGARKGALTSRAPELITSETEEPTLACDIYSFGVLCVEVGILVLSKCH